MSGKAGKTGAEARARADKKVDKAVDMSFPASDPTAHGRATSTEAPSRPQGLASDEGGVIDRYRPLGVLRHIQRLWAGLFHRLGAQGLRVPTHQLL